MTEPPRKPSTSTAELPERLGRYRLQERLGQGGMGFVHAALDESLDRRVAIKMLNPGTLEPRARERLWREARAAASISHPNICQVFEVGEHEGRPYLVLELLTGEALATRMERGALDLGEAVPITLGVLNALDALHERGFVHRDIKPSNVYLTAHGPKLLDFGLTRPSGMPETGRLDFSITMPGFVVGTPRYMAPEQLGSEEPDARTDLFSLGAILYEMLAGKPAFSGKTAVEIFQAVLNRQPPALGGSQAIGSVNRIVLKALAKTRDERYASAREMADDLRAALRAPDVASPAPARPVTRLIVLPFRLLRPDPEVDFLALSLPEAITTSLAGVPALQLRSSLSAARFAETIPDPAMLAEELSVDLAVTGSLMRAGDEIRVTAQLVETPSGTVRWSESWRVPMREMFSLEEAVTQHVLDSIVMPETERVRHRAGHAVPASATAYEYFLRAGQQGYGLRQWHVSRDLLLQALEADPRYAPAWAKLARIYYLMAKYGGEDIERNLERADEALARALAIDPELPIAHTLKASFAVNSGRALEAMRDLVNRARAHPNDASLFSSLVQACRYVGLLDASVAAHEHARRLDPRILTSVPHTFWMRGELERALVGAEQDGLYDAMIMKMLGRDDAAREIIARTPVEEGVGLMRTWNDFARALVADDREGMERVLLPIAAGEVGRDYDAEGMFYLGHALARIDYLDEAMHVLRESVARGFQCYPVFARLPDFDPLRMRPDFVELLRRVEAYHCDAAQAFRREGGDVLLGLRAAAQAAA